MIKRYIAIVLMIASMSVLTLIGFSNNQSRAALNIYGNREYDTQLKTTVLEITAYENNNNFENLNALLSEYADDDSFKIGNSYNEVISVKNTGNCAEYVRAVVRKYWTDKDGNKITEYKDVVTKNGSKSNVPLNNDYIVLGGGDSSWKLNNAEKTAETSVYYYEKPLAVGDEVVLFENFKIDDQVYDFYTDEIVEEYGSKTLIRSYLYDGLKYNVEIDFQSLQYLDGSNDVNQSAIRSVWGVDSVTVNGSTLSVGE